MIIVTVESYERISGNFISKENYPLDSLSFIDVPFEVRNELIDQMFRSMKDEHRRNFRGKLLRRPTKVITILASCSLEDDDKEVYINVFDVRTTYHEVVIKNPISIGKVRR